MSDKPKARPYVQVAALCERVLTEKDNVQSLIRIVDCFAVATPPTDLLPEGATPIISMQLVVALKGCGELQGDYEVTIQLRGPTKVNELAKVKVSFTGDHAHGTNILMNVALGVSNYGDCSFDVLWYGDLLTRVPFKLIPQTNSSARPAGDEKKQ